MADTNGSLTVEGLAQILRDHMAGTAARFAEVGARIDELRGQIAIAAGQILDLSQIALRQAEAMEEHRQEIRQILDAMEHRGGDGGGREQQAA